MRTASGRTYEDAPVGTVPPMVPVDARTEKWMAEHHYPNWREDLAAVFE